MVDIEVCEHCGTAICWKCREDDDCPENPVNQTEVSSGSPSGDDGPADTGMCEHCAQVFPMEDLEPCQHCGTDICRHCSEEDCDENPENFPDL
jgi:hypothetical protein